MPTSYTWHCVLDHSMRLVYLGTDEAEANRAAVDGAMMRSSSTMGNAMRLAALAFGQKRLPR
jgi:hypothetical protein